MKQRRLPSSSFFFFFFFSASLILLRLCHGQQGYLNNDQLSCTDNSSISTTLGYNCNGASNSCDTYVIIRSHQSPRQLASLLSSNATAISAINGIPVNSSAPTDSHVIVPISCSCSFAYYQHNVSYTLKPSDIYFSVANNTYTGLSTCQALIAQNPSHNATDLSPGDIITVPLRCACPTITQVNQGVRYLLTYSPVFTDDIPTLASRFNVTADSILNANNLYPFDVIFPYTTLLIPLQTPPSKAQTITPPPPPRTPEPPPSPPSSEQGGGGGSDKTGLYIGVAVGVVAFLTPSGVAVCWFFSRRRRQLRDKPACYVIPCWHSRTSEDQTIETFLQKHGALPPKRYSYLEVKRMTESFHHKLGEGGFGSVFKGTLIDGHGVAVKLLNDTKGDGEEFLNEVASIGRTSHINIVTLLGFCFQGSKRALIYDFMPNGSLEKYIYAEDPKTILGWEKLFQIATGTARGLEYLHRGCNTRIVHFDIKPHNILLDEDFSPKISDFGLAKLGTHKESILSMAGARGTVGFIAPEVFSRNFGVVSTKSDVYSYGMMLMEMAGGRRNVKVLVDRTSEIYFPNWIYDHLDQDEWLQYCGVTLDTQEIARKLIIVGLWCIQTRPECRPTMSRVAEMLQGSITDLKIPPKPYLSSPPRSPSTCSMTSVS